MDNHTPTPEKIAHWDKFTSRITGEIEFTIWNKDGFRIGTAINEHQATLIVRAVNAYEHTLKALMRYGSHDNSCSCANPTSEEKHECSCGLWEAQAIAKAESRCPECGELFAAGVKVHAYHAAEAAAKATRR